CENSTIRKFCALASEIGSSGENKTTNIQPRKRIVCEGSVKTSKGGDNRDDGKGKSQVKSAVLLFGYSAVLKPKNDLWLRFSRPICGQINFFNVQ
ncbi:hypothetical protein M5D96_013825, partial [Drosophila gunungcola]